MKACIVIGCILLALLLIGQIRVGASVRYSGEGLFAAIKAGPLRISVLPARKRRKTGKKTPKKKPKPEEKPTKEKKPLKDTLALAMRFVPLLGEAAGGLKRKIRIDRISMHVIWGAENPASAAMGFGAGNAALGILWPILEHNFKVKDHELGVDVDFSRKKPELDVDAQATLTIAQGMALSLRLGVMALKIFLGVRREQNEQKAVQQ